MKRIAILLIAIMVFSTLPYSPEIKLNNENKLLSGASDADVSVSGLDITTPSVMISGIPIVSPMVHIVRISIFNYGGSDANGTLYLSVNDGSSVTEVDDRSINILAGQQENHLLYWDSTEYTSGVSLIASWVINSDESDSDPSNNNYILSNINIYDIEDASILTTTLPTGENPLVRATWSGTISVANTGTLPVDVTALLSLTSTLGGDPIPISSTTVQPSVGSLSNPAPITDIDITFDGTALEGEYILSGFVEVVGANGNTDTITISSVQVEFTSLRAILSTPINRNIDPGQSTSLSFLLQNSGNQTDSFTVTQSNLSGWANAAPEIYSVSDPLVLVAGAASIIQISVTVPANAAISASDRITIIVHSIGNQYDLTSSAVVMAGELYEGTMIQSSGNPKGDNYVDIAPGIANSVTIDYVLNNTGTAPSQYDISVGMLEATPYWSIDSPVELTNLLLPGENITIPVTITLPELEMPILSSWKIDADILLHLRVQATPLSGGISIIATTYITVLPIVIIDFEIEDTERCYDEGQTEWFCVEDVDEEEVLGASVIRIVDFQIQAKHNLDATGQGSAVVSLDYIETFTPAVTGATPFEYMRWNVGITPQQLELNIGETGYGQIAISSTFNTNFPYPAAGEYKIDINASTIFSVSDFNGNTPLTSVNETTFKFDVMELEDAELVLKSRGTGSPGTSITAEMTLTNMGNSPNTFNVSYIGEPGWTITVTNPGTIKSRLDSFQSPSSTFSKDFTVTAVPPATARADKIHAIWIYVTSIDNPENYLAYAAAEFKLDELISAELNSGSSVAILDRLGTSTIMFELNNTGNSNQTFDLKLENSDDNYLQVSFSEYDTEIETEKSMIVNSGNTAIIRVYSKTSNDARADESRSFDLILINNDSELDRKTMSVTVNPDHALTLQGSTTFFAQPGTEIQTSFNLINLGNLLETNVSFNPFLPETSTSGIWAFNTLENLTISPGSDNGIDIIMNISLPNIGPNVMLEAGATYTIPIQIFSYDFTQFNGDYLILGSTTLVVTIEPYFELDIVASFENMMLIPGQTRSFEYTVENSGNAPASVNVNYNLAVSDPDRWKVSFPNLPSTSFIIPIAETYSISMEITPNAADHYVGESGFFDIIFSSSDDSEETQAYSTLVEIVRIQTDTDVIVDPGSSGQGEGLLPCANTVDTSITERCRIYRIPWMHVPYLGSTDETPVDYSLTALEIQRHIDGSAYPDSTWNFYVEDTILLSTVDFSVDSELVKPYDIGSKFDLVFIIPPTEELAPGDGWSITFRLKNSNEPNNEDYWTDFTVDIVTTTTSDPKIKDIYFIDGAIIEGTSAILIVQVMNAGDAIMPLGAEVQVSCNGKYLDSFNSGTQVIPVLPSQQSFNSTWQISAKSIPWWSTSETLKCTAELTGTAVEVKGNHIDNDLRSEDLTIDSWAPPSYKLKVGSNEIGISISIFISIILLLGSLYFYRNGVKDFTPSYVHLSSYMFSAGLGALALTNLFYLLPLICAVLAILGSIKIAWTSSSEVQAIYNDRKKSLTGARATISNHDIQIKKTIKELRAIISCSPLILLLIMILNPNLTIDSSNTGLLGLIIFVVVSPLLIHIVLRYLDKSYNKIYSQLGQLELRAMKIKKILASQNSSNRFQPRNRLRGPE